jgi:putative SOS response-associated peptidase YedK
MCGRTTHRLTWEEIHRLYSLTARPPSNFEPRYNICPTQTIGAVIEQGGRRELVPMRWGLVPSWWKKKAKETPASFNARAETVAEKPMFRGAFKRSRCLIPISGYYEWKTVEGGAKQPYYFTRVDGAPITVAGLWDEWKDIETGEPLKSCTMIITAANEFTSDTHDRMPAILEPESFGPWLSGTAGAELLGPAANDLLRKWAVSRRVNSSRTKGDDSTLIDRLPRDAPPSWLMSGSILLLRGGAGQPQQSCSKIRTQRSEILHCPKVIFC